VPVIKRYHNFLRSSVKHTTKSKWDSIIYVVKFLYCDLVSHEGFIHRLCKPLRFGESLSKVEYDILIAVFT
jgi:hypothetical protein